VRQDTHHHRDSRSETTLFPFATPPVYPRSAHPNGHIANSPSPSYLPPSDSFIVVSLSPYRIMYLYTYTTSTLHMRIRLTFLNAPSSRTLCGSSPRRLGTVSRRSRRGCHSCQEHAPGLFLFWASGPSLRSLRKVTPSPNPLVEPSDRLFYALDGYGHRSTPHLSKHHTSLLLRCDS
jgi:hypothetical protein